MVRLWAVAVLLVVVCTPPLSTIVHNAVLMPWVLPFSAIRTQELVAGAQISLVVTEACKLRLFDHLDPNRAISLSWSSSHESLTFREAVETFIGTGTWTRQCRTIDSLVSSIRPKLSEERSSRILFRVLNSLATTGLVGVSNLNRGERDFYHNPAETGCYFITNPSSMFLTTVDVVSSKPVKNTASMCGMGIIGNNNAVLTRLGGIASLLMSEDETVVGSPSFVQPKTQKSEDDDLWVQFAVNSDSFQSRVSSRVAGSLMPIIGSERAASQVTVVDVGGGSGTFLNSILAELQREQITHVGVLFDLPNVVQAFPECGQRGVFCEGGSVFENSSLISLSNTISSHVKSKGHDVVLVFGSFLQHFDDMQAHSVVDTVLYHIVNENVERVIVAIVELVTPGSEVASAPYFTPTPLHAWKALWKGLTSANCGLYEVGACFRDVVEFFAFDGFTGMGRVFSTVMSSLTSSASVEGGEVRSNRYYYHLLATLEGRLNGLIHCEVPTQKTLFPLPATVSIVVCVPQ